ncbi:O-antigen ligase family protein [bacterium]|nr:O-antigen ligase family protein [bacterium]
MNQRYREFSGRRFISQQHLLWATIILICAAVGVSSLYLKPVIFIALAGLMIGIVLLIRYPYVGLLLYFITFVIRPGEMFPALDALSLERVIGIGVLITAILGHKKKYGTFSLPHDFSFLMLLGFWAVIIVSLSVSFDPPRTQDSIENFLKLIVFYMIIVYTVDTRTKFNIFMGLFLFMMFREMFLSFRDYYGGGAIVRMGIQRATGRGSFGSGANTLAATLAFTVPFFIAWLKYFRGRLARIVLLGVLFMFLIMIVNTGSRGGLLATLTVVAVTVWYSKYRLAGAVGAVVFLVVGWILLPDQYKGRYETLVSGGDVNEISTNRVEIWENGIRIWEDRPLLGCGSGAFAPTSGSGEYGPKIFMSPHSLYVQLLAEVGLLGFLTFFVFIASLFHQVLTTPNRLRAPPDNPDLVRWYHAHKEAFVASMLAMLVNGGTAHNLFRWNWYMYAGMIAAMAAIYLKTAVAEKVGVDPDQAGELPDSVIEEVGA